MKLYEQHSQDQQKKLQVVIYKYISIKIDWTDGNCKGFVHSI